MSLGAWGDSPHEEWDEEALECMGWCLDEGLTITWTAYGTTKPDEDGLVFEPADEAEETCPWCGGTEWGYH